jgi:hypothetical protein
MTVLRELHDELDRAVLDAYGWLTDTLAALRDGDGWRRLLASYSLN